MNDDARGPAASPAGAGSRPTRKRMKRFYPRADLKTRIVALPEHGLVYVKNPKAASSTLMLWLDRIHTGDYAFDTDKAHRDNHLPTADAVGWDLVSDMLSGSAYRFTFVREPLGRFESAYHNKVARLRGWRVKVQNVLGLPADRDAPVSFEQFLSAVEQQDPLEMDLHWRPQYLNLMHPLVSYDLVGHVENFDRDVRELRRHVQLPDLEMESRNVSRHKPPTSVYDGRPDLVRRVRDVFAQDFEVYGY
jgi:Sulfotransferase family